jgi:hypothetical protein
MLKSSSTLLRRCTECQLCGEVSDKSLICQATITAHIGAECGGKLAFHTCPRATLPSVMYYFTVT